MFDHHLGVHQFTSTVDNSYVGTFDDRFGNISHTRNDSVALTMTAARRLWAYRAGGYLQTIWIPIVVPIGLIGNILSILITLQKSNRHISCCIYMSGLAMADTGALCIYAYYWASTDIFKRTFNILECKVIVWLFQCTTIYGTYLIVFMTFDRCLVVKFPLNAATWCSCKRATRTLGVLLCLVLLYTVPFVCFADIVNNGLYCSSFAINTIWSKTFSWVTICFNSVIPFVSILIMNSIIIVTLNKNAAFRRNNSNMVTRRFARHWYRKREKYDYDLEIGARKSKGKRITTRERQLIRMLMLVTFALLVLTLPQYIRYAVYLFVDNTVSPQRYAIYIFIYNLTNKLYFTNSAVNFFLYCIGGSKFRYDVIHLCRCHNKKKYNDSYPMCERSPSYRSVTDQYRENPTSNT